jgi:dihydroneopterin aldolase
MPSSVFTHGSDGVEDTVDYSAVSDTVTKFIVGGEFHLLETLADGLARELLDCYSLSWLRLRVSKPGAVPTADDVGVVVERGAHLQNGTP